MTVDLSVICPLYNEQESVNLLYCSIRDVLVTLELNSEIVFVDDGSRDRTFEIAASLPRQSGNVRLKVVKFRRNYGQTAAMAAGIEHAIGRILITMDGDLQNDPADIPLFLAEIERGHDLVVGWRYKRQDHWSRVLPSKVANWLIGKVTGVPIKDNGCSLKAYRADLIKEIPLYSEMHRFIPAMSSLAGARISEIKVRHHARRFGASKYGFSRIYKVFLDLLAIGTLLAFNKRPSFWLSVGAALSALLSMICLVLAAVHAFDPLARSSIVFGGIAALFGSLGIFLVFLGLLTQLVYTTTVRRFDPFRRLAARQVTVDRPDGMADRNALLPTKGVA